MKMTSLHNLRSEIDTTKRELKNIRQEILKQKANMKTETEKIKSLFCETNIEHDVVKEEKSIFTMTPIGYISSCFKFKNGIPRQPSLCPTAKGTLKIEKSLFTNPEHSLIGLEEYSHIWILFAFHESVCSGIKAKVHPPRLKGASLGVFSTRSPHRPSPLGLSLTKLDKVKGDTLYLSGIDLLDGTPVLDIKPYIPMYDNPIYFKEACEYQEEIKNISELPSIESNNCDNDGSKNKFSEEIPETEKHLSSSEELKIPKFLKETPEKLDVMFTNRAITDLEQFEILSTDDKLFDVLHDLSKLKQAIIEVLQNDPRSIYRREKCSDRLYYFYINNFHVTCWFDDPVVEVLRIKSSITKKQ